MKNTNEKKEENKEKQDFNFYSKLKQIEPKPNSKKNVTWDDNPLVNNNNMSLLIEEIMPINAERNTDKMDILINKVDVLIDLMTVLTKQLNK
jgi:hypothetical protein